MWRDRAEIYIRECVYIVQAVRIKARVQTNANTWLAHVPNSIERTNVYTTDDGCTCTLHAHNYAVSTRASILMLFL